MVDNAPRQVNLNDDTRQVLTQQFASLRRMFENRHLLTEQDQAVLKNLFNAAEYEVKALIKTNILPLWRPATRPDDDPYT